MRYRTRSAAATRKLGELLAQEVMRGNASGPRVIALFGELGSGKTTFVQGFARGCGIKRLPTSPTFVFMRRYPLHRRRFKNLFHIDAYRITRSADAASTGITKVLSDPLSIVLIEWAEKVRRILPHNTVRVLFSHGTREEERIISL